MSDWKRHSFGFFRASWRRKVYLYPLLLVTLLAACTLPFSREAILRADGKEQLLRSKAGTVAEFLAENNVSLGELDRVSPSADTPVSQGLRVTVVRVRQEERLVTEAIPAPREEVADPDGSRGMVTVLRPGADGQRQVTYRLTLEDGVEIRRDALSERVLQSPTPERVAVGQRATPTLDAFEAAAREILGQPGGRRLSAVQIDYMIRELAQKTPGGQARILHKEGTFPLTLVAFSRAGDRLTLLVFWWQKQAALSQRLADAAYPLDARLQAAGDTWELFLIAGHADTLTPSPDFLLLRLSGDAWRTVWSSASPPSPWNSSGGGVSFDGDGSMNRLLVSGQERANGDGVFAECPACAHREVRAVWQRQGDAYVAVESQAAASPYAILWAFLDRLRRGDEAGAAALTLDKNLVYVAESLGLDDPRVTWNTANRPDDAVLDFSGPPGSFRATMQRRGDIWMLDTLARSSAEGRILYTEETRAPSRRILSLDPERGSPLSLAEGSAYVWSPDYRLIAYEKGGFVYLLNADGTGNRRLADGLLPVWSPSGNRLAFQRPTPGGLVIWIAADDGSAPRAIASGHSPRWSPDGQRIAYAFRPAGADREAVFTVQADGAGQSLFSSDGRAPAWSPDGRYLAFITQAGDIVAVEVSSGQISLLGNGDRYAWSPDGRRVAYLSDGRLFVAEIEGAARAIAAWEDVESLSWSPDGQRLAVGRSNREVWLMGSDGKDARKLVDGRSPVWAWQ